MCSVKPYYITTSILSLPHYRNHLFQDWFLNISSIFKLNIETTSIWRPPYYKNYLLKTCFHYLLYIETSSILKVYYFSPKYGLNIMFFSLCVFFGLYKYVVPVLFRSAYYDFIFKLLLHTQLCHLAIFPVESNMR